MEKPELKAEEIIEIDDMIAYRKKLNMSQKKFADAIGASLSNIQYVEQYRQPISMTLREKIALHRKETKYHTASMDDYQEVLKRAYPGNEAAKKIIPLIRDHIEAISMPANLDDKRKQTAYLNFLERTLAEYENVCRQGAEQILYEQNRELTGAISGLRKIIIDQQNSAVKKYEK